MYFLLILFSIKPSLLFLAESTDDDISDAMFKESCITEQTQYFFDNDEKSYSGVLDCGNCSRYVYVSSQDSPYASILVALSTDDFKWLLLKIFKFLLGVHLFNGLWGLIQKRIGFLVSFCFAAWFQTAAFWWVLITHRLPWSVRARNCRGKQKKPFFICFSSFTLWQYVKLTNTHIYRPLHICFAVTYVCITLGCLRG